MSNKVFDIVRCGFIAIAIILFPVTWLFIFTAYSLAAFFIFILYVFAHAVLVLWMNIRNWLFGEDDTYDGL